MGASHKSIPLSKKLKLYIEYFIRIVQKKNLPLNISNMSDKNCECKCNQEGAAPVKKAHKATLRGSNARKRFQEKLARGEELRKEQGQRKGQVG